MRKSHTERKQVFQKILRSSNNAARFPRQSQPHKKLFKGLYERETMNFLRFGSPTEVLVHIPKHVGTVKPHSPCKVNLHPLIEPTPLQANPEEKSCLSEAKRLVESVSIPLSSFTGLKLPITRFSMWNACEDNSNHFNLAPERINKIRTELFGKYLSVKPRVMKTQAYFKADSLEFLKSIQTGTLIEIYSTLIKTPDIVNSTDIAGNSAMHFAAKLGKPKILKLLIVFHGNINARNLKGKTPLHISVKRNNIEISQILLKAGANLRITDCAGNFPSKLAKNGTTLRLLCGFN